MADGKRGIEGWLKEPYILINMILAGVILMVLVYSGIFSPEKENYPVACIHEKITGLPCISCGLSRSFSLILRGRIDDAYTLNVYGIQVFIFFLLQLLLRFSFSAWYIKYPANRLYLILTDSAGSFLLFILAFWPYMKWISNQL